MNNNLNTSSQHELIKSPLTNKSSVWSFLFSAAFTFILYIYLRPPFIFSWLNNRSMVEGGQEVTTFSTQFLFFAVVFLLISLNVFVIRRMKPWASILISIPIILFAINFLMQAAGRLSDFTSAFMSAVLALFTPISYLYLLSYSHIILISLVPIYIFVFGSQWIFDRFLKSSTARPMVAILFLIGGMYLANQQIGSFSKLNFVSTDSLPRAEISQIKNLRVQFQNTAEVSGADSVLAVVTEFKRQAEELKGACKGQSKTLEIECYRLYDTAISDNGYLLQTILSNFDKGMKELIRYDDIKIGEGAVVGRASVVRLCETIYPYPADSTNNYATVKVITMDVANKLETTAFYQSGLYEVVGILGMKEGGTRTLYYRSFNSDDNGRPVSSYQEVKTTVSVLYGDTNNDYVVCKVGQFKFK